METLTINSLKKEYELFKSYYVVWKLSHTENADYIEK